LQDKTFGSEAQRMREAEEKRLYLLKIAFMIRTAE
jgi:hypothetical protein